MSSKETILASAKLVKGILDGTMYKDDFYKDDDVTEKVPSEKAKKQQLEILKYNMDFVKNNDKYLEGVTLDENESEFINFSKSETVSTFLENGKSNWDNHGGGSSEKYFSNPSISLENDVMIFNVQYDKSSLDFPDYLEVNNITENILYTGNGSPRDGKPLRVPVNVGLYVSKFKKGTVLVFTIYSDRGQRSTVSYTI